YYLVDSGDAFAELVEPKCGPQLVNAGASILATFVTEKHPNTFPALRVREGENVFVSFSRFANRQTFEQHANLIVGKNFRAPGFRLIENEPEILLLAPTARSLLR